MVINVYKGYGSDKGGQFEVRQDNCDGQKELLLAQDGVRAADCQITRAQIRINGSGSQNLRT